MIGKDYYAGVVEAQNPLELWSVFLKVFRIRTHGYGSSTIPRAATTRTDTRMGYWNYRGAMGYRR